MQQHIQIGPKHPKRREEERKEGGVLSRRLPASECRRYDRTWINLSKYHQWRLRHWWRFVREHDKCAIPKLSPHQLLTKYKRRMVLLPWTDLTCYLDQVIKCNIIIVWHLTFRSPGVILYSVHTVHVRINLNLLKLLNLTSSLQEI